MKALTFHGIETIRYEEVPDPRILDPRDAIVKVSHTAICGSDLHVYHGREKGLDNGTVMGHEFAGTIIQTGEGVNNLKPGDQVVSPFSTNCGSCFYCQSGLPARCVNGQLFGWVQNGKGLHGAQAELVRVPYADSTLVRIPAGIPVEQALFAGDILSTGYFSADRAGISSEGIYAVIGCGPVGLFAVQSALEMGAGKVFALDTLDYRLEIAASYGAIPIRADRNPRQAILVITGGRLPDATIEAVGSPAASRLAFDLLRPGGTLSAVGVQTSDHFAFSPVEAYDKNITLSTGRCPARYYMELLLPVLGEGKFPADSIITHRLPLKAGPDAYRLFDRKEDGCIKIVLNP